MSVTKASVGDRMATLCFCFNHASPPEPCYPCSISTDRVDSPLRAGSSLTVGYGTSGDFPFICHLRADEEIDIGFLKLFLTTSQTDFGSFQQASPFDMARAPCTKSEVMNKLTQGDWDTVMAMVVQRAIPGSLVAPLQYHPPSFKHRQWPVFSPWFSIADCLIFLLLLMVVYFQW